MPMEPGSARANSECQCTACASVTTCDSECSALPRRRRGAGERRARPCPRGQVQQEQVVTAPRAPRRQRAAGGARTRPPSPAPLTPNAAARALHTCGGSEGQLQGFAHASSRKMVKGRDRAFALACWLVKLMHTLSNPGMLPCSAKHDPGLPASLRRVWFKEPHMLHSVLWTSSNMPVRRSGSMPLPSVMTRFHAQVARSR